MKKNELINKISDIYGMVEDLESSIVSLRDEARSIRNNLDNLPSEVEEIEEDEKIDEI